MLILPSMLLLADGRFPAGGYANSCGAESAVHYGDIVDVESMERYLRARLRTTGVTDAAFAARSNSAAITPCKDAEILGSEILGSEILGSEILELLDHEYNCRTASPRLRAVSRQFGRQLCRSARSVWPHPALDKASATPDGCHQAVVLGLAAAAAGGTPAEAALLVLHHMSSAVATAAVRMLGLDPLVVAASQASVTSEFAEIVQNAELWATSDPVDLPALTSTMTEVLAQDHGRWDARLFVA